MESAKNEETKQGWYELRSQWIELVIGEAVPTVEAFDQERVELKMRSYVERIGWRESQR